MNHHTIDLADLRNCPDHMTIQQYRHLLNVCPNMLVIAIRGGHVRMEGRKGRHRHYPGRGFAAKYAGTYCEQCRAEIRRGERVAFGVGGMFGHHLCIAAAWVVENAADDARAAVDAEQARRRRQRQPMMNSAQARAMLDAEARRRTGRA